MTHVTILLSLSFFIQTVGYIGLRKFLHNKSMDINSSESRKDVKNKMNYIVIGLVIQLVVIIYQVTAYFLFVRNLGS